MQFDHGIFSYETEYSKDRGTVDFGASTLLPVSSTVRHRVPLVGACTHDVFADEGPSSAVMRGPGRSTPRIRSTA